MHDLQTAWRPRCYVCMSSSELDKLQRAFRAASGKWSTFVIWAKHTFSLGRSDYQRQYEPILYGWRDGSHHDWCGARDQGDVWFFDKLVRNDLHPTMKPVALVERAIRNSSKTRDIVLDPFGGSGSTLIACEKAGRQARLVELDPKYVDVIILRWQGFSGGAAILDEEGRGASKRFATKGRPPACWHGGLNPAPPYRRIASLNPPGGDVASSAENGVRWPVKAVQYSPQYRTAGRAAWAVWLKVLQTDLGEEIAAGARGRGGVGLARSWDQLTIR